MANAHLHKAKREKNDEFYTLYEDIEKEMAYYKESLKGKVVYCNCDDPNKSNFFKFFCDHFKEFGLKKVIATGYNKDGKGWYGEYVED